MLERLVHHLLHYQLTLVMALQQFFHLACVLWQLSLVLDRCVWCLLQTWCYWVLLSWPQRNLYKAWVYSDVRLSILNARRTAVKHLRYSWGSTDQGQVSIESFAGVPVDFLVLTYYRLILCESLDQDFNLLSRLSFVDGRQVSCFHSAVLQSGWETIIALLKSFVCGLVRL